MLLLNPTRQVTSEGVPFALTQFELSRAAGGVGQYGVLRVALTPIVGAYAQGLRRLDLLGFELTEPTGIAFIGRVVADIAGPSGAAPTSPSTELHKMLRDVTTFPQSTARFTGLTSTTAITATPDTAVVAEGDRVLDTVFGFNTPAAQGKQHVAYPQAAGPQLGFPMPYYLPSTNPHLTGWGIEVIAEAANVVFTVRFNVYIKEYYV